MTPAHVVAAALAVACLMVGMAAGITLGQDQRQPVSQRVAQTRTLRLAASTVRYRVTTPGGTVLVGSPPRTVREDGTTIHDPGRYETSTRTVEHTQTHVGIVTLPARTVTRTTTLPASTITLPASTVTETETTTVTETAPPPSTGDTGG